MTFFEFVLLYLLGQADAIHNGLEVLAAISGGAVAVSCFTLFIFNIDNHYSEWKIPSIIKYGFTCVTGLALVLHMFIPQTKTVAIILGGSIVLEAARNDQVKNIATSGLAVIEQELQKYLDKSSEAKK